MKKITLLLVSIFLFSFGYSQSGYISLNKDSLCLGESVVAMAYPPSYSLATPVGTNNHNGVMFDITADYAAKITGFLINPVSSGYTFYLYYRTGSHVGYENSSTGWTLVDSASNVSSGTNVNPGFNINQAIVGGQTLAFYITSSGTNYLYYDNGTSVGTTLASDNYLTIKEGVGKSYPFGASYTTRNFVGSVLYEPQVTSYLWNFGGTGMQKSLTPQRSEVLSCDLELSNTTTVSVNAVVPVKEVEVNTTANPSSIQPGQSSTLKANVTLHGGLATAHDGTNSHNGAMFDITAIDTSEITGFTVNCLTTTGDIEISYKTGTHVGSEGNSNAWTSLSTYTNIPAKQGRYLALPSSISIIPGQTIAFYITRTDGGRLAYSNGTLVGNTASSGHGLKILEGTGVVYPFGNTYTPRILNTIVHFTSSDVSSATYAWSGGGSSSSKLVSPVVTTAYTVDVSLGGCMKTDTVTVQVNNIGLEDRVSEDFKIYPNPATEYLNIEFNLSDEVSEVSLLDLNGRELTSTFVSSSKSNILIPISAYPSGLYVLKVKLRGIPSFFKIEIL